jgi:hypothetical protein
MPITFDMASASGVLTVEKAIPEAGNFLRFLHPL